MKVATPIEVTYDRMTHFSLLLTTTRVRDLANNLDIPTALLRKLAREGNLMSEHGEAVHAWLVDNDDEGTEVDHDDIADIEVRA